MSRAGKSTALELEEKKKGPDSVITPERFRRSRVLLLEGVLKQFFCIWTAIGARSPGSSLLKHRGFGHFACDIIAEGRDQKAVHSGSDLQKRA